MMFITPNPAAQKMIASLRNTVASRPRIISEIPSHLISLNVYLPALISASP